MPVITAAEPQKKNPHRFNIYLDGQFAFGADEDLVVSRRLIIGKVIKPEDITTLIFESEIGKLMEKMYRLFSVRQRSEREVRDYIRIKNHQSRMKDKPEVGEMVIDVLIDQLKKKGLVNDLEFAKAWTKARRTSKQKGMQAIKSELFQKGIDREIIEQVLGDSQDESEELLAEQAARKKLRLWQGLDEQGFKKKSYEFLARRGFDYSTINTVVAKLLKER